MEERRYLDGHAEPGQHQSSALEPAPGLPLSSLFQPWESRYWSGQPGADPERQSRRGTRIPLYGSSLSFQKGWGWGTGSWSQGREQANRAGGQDCPGLNTRPQQSSWAWHRAPVLLRIVYMAQLIKKSQTCLPLFSTVASWLHSQGALKLGLQADGTSAHWQQAAPSWGERTESLTGEPWSQREKRPQRPLIPGVLKLCCVSASPLEMAESLRNTQVKLMHPEVIWFPGSQH